MTSELLGRPEGSEAYDDDRKILATTYETLVATPVCSNSEQLSAALANGDLACGMGVSETEALVNVWKVVCQSPALTGVGL